MSDDSLRPRRPGRPRLDAASPSADIHLRVTASVYDRLWSEARRQRASVQDVIRRSLQRALREAGDEDQ